MDTPKDNSKGPIDRVSSVNEQLSDEIRPEDERALSNAYVSGMETDLELLGNEYNYFTTFFNIGYMIMLYPSCIIISHIGPAIWLPACEVYGLRFLIGFFEGATWPGYFTIISETINTQSQWYLPHEMALRMSLYNMAQPVGAMLSGAMQETAIARTRRVGRKPQIGIQVKSFLRCFKFWHLWLFAIAWAIGTGTTPTSYFNLWLKSLKNPDGSAK
ncbi:major facilitator superfamily transporter [Aspergillus luchuensis]|uniref:Major facilitator superfamily transporter n=1 Tax=Aspergillus kawachii TaxID=1069201 RepID=A0A146FFS9_ASPKA|nr:major facilitator superfamily transporter [Aspergillus luchuensis]